MERRAHAPLRYSLQARIGPSETDVPQKPSWQHPGEFSYAAGGNVSAVCARRHAALPDGRRLQQSLRLSSTLASGTKESSR